MSSVELPAECHALSGPPQISDKSPWQPEATEPEWLCSERRASTATSHDTAVQRVTEGGESLWRWILIYQPFESSCGPGIRRVDFVTATDGDIFQLQSFLP